MDLLRTITTLIVLFSFSCILRVFYVFKFGGGYRKPKRATSDTCSLAIFLGSGGHTTEALALVSALDFARYTPRTYIISDGDTLSAQKAREMEERKCDSDPKSKYTLLYVPRARNVHQPLWTTPPSVLFSFVVCVRHTVQAALNPGSVWDVLVLNGPGTCFSICAAVFFNRFLGLPSPRMIYVESFARVNWFTPAPYSSDDQYPDRFIVQWPDILQQGGRGQYFGWLV